MFLSISKNSLRNIIILMMMLMAVPCTAKQAIKKSLHIPVAEHVVKHQKLSNCTTFVRHSETKSAQTFVKFIPQPNAFSLFSKANFSYVVAKRILYRAFHNAIPIYILHQQYLI